MTNSSVCFRSDEGGRLSFLRTRTLGDRIRDTRTWARNRRSSSDKELTPGKEPPPDTAPRTAAETNGCGPASLPGVAEVEEAGDHDTSASSAGDPTSIPGAEMASSSPGPGSRLSRIFSLRRTSEPPAFNERTHPELMQPLQEEDESLLGSLSAAPMSAPPSLPPPPQLMSADQTKRRFIINSLVQSENNYLDSLGRLIADYKVPLEESSPPILSDPKVATMFYRVPEIQQIHSQFRIALTEAVKNWDEVNNPPRNLCIISVSWKRLFLGLGPHSFTVVCLCIKCHVLGLKISKSSHEICFRTRRSVTSSWPHSPSPWCSRSTQTSSTTSARPWTSPSASPRENLHLGIS